MHIQQISIINGKCKPKKGNTETIYVTAEIAKTTHVINKQSM